MMIMIIIIIIIIIVTIIIIIIIIIIKSLFNIGHIHSQRFSLYVPSQANKNQPWNIIDIIITVVFVHNT